MRLHDFGAPSHGGDRAGFRVAAAAAGQRIGDDDRRSTIIGVVDDLRFRSPRDPVNPTACFSYALDISDLLAAVRYATQNPEVMAAALEAAWKRVAPGDPFQARTIEDNLFRRYYK